MLCEMTRESPTIDEEIEVALEFFEGKIISRDKESTPCEESVRNGEIVYLEIAPAINNIKTDKEQIYRVKFYVQVVNAKSPEKEGVSEIVITNSCVGSIIGVIAKDMKSVTTIAQSLMLFMYAPAILNLFPKIPGWIQMLFPTYYFFSHY